MKGTVGGLLLWMTTGITLFAQSFDTLYSFCAQTGCPDGYSPAGRLVQATDGNLYGATWYGADSNAGTIYRITGSGVLTTLYRFCAQNNCGDGSHPNGLIQARNGHLYGTTLSGGTNCGTGCGTVFRITVDGALTTLYQFCSQSPCTDGYEPEGTLFQAANGDFYGTTYYGGSAHDGGTVFKITADGTFATVYRFCHQKGCPDGDLPGAGLIQATDGNLYGTTTQGGAHGWGTVFKMTPNGTLTTLYSFCAQSGCTDGKEPHAELVEGSDGNLYGTTLHGGKNSPGTVFEITLAGTLTTLYTFCSQTNCEDGKWPSAGLVQGTDGNFYGTTSDGGVCRFCGTMFKITHDGTLTTPHKFCTEGYPCPDGEGPNAIVQATDGSFYGTTVGGGVSNGGTIFRLL